MLLLGDFIYFGFCLIIGCVLVYWIYCLRVLVLWMLLLFVAIVCCLRWLVARVPLRVCFSDYVYLCYIGLSCWLFGFAVWLLFICVGGLLLAVI